VEINVVGFHPTPHRGGRMPGPLRLPRAAGASPLRPDGRTRRIRAEAARLRLRQCDL